MKKSTFIKTVLAFAVLLVSSCQYKEPHEQGQNFATQLNDKGYEFLSKYFFDCNPTQLDSALMCFQEALAIDKNHSAAKANLKVALMRMKNYGKLIDIMLQELETINPQDHFSKAEMLGFVALLYNRIGSSDSEKEMRMSAFDEYVLALSDGAKSIQPYQLMGYLKFKTYMEGKETAMAELEQYEGMFCEEEYKAIKEELESYEINDWFESGCDEP